MRKPHHVNKRHSALNLEEYTKLLSTLFKLQAELMNNISDKSYSDIEIMVRRVSNIKAQINKLKPYNIPDSIGLSNVPTVQQIIPIK